jgi:hypothetical protein
MRFQNERSSGKSTSSAAVTGLGFATQPLIVAEVIELVEAVEHGLILRFLTR